MDDEILLISSIITGDIKKVAWIPHMSELDGGDEERFGELIEYYGEYYQFRSSDININMDINDIIFDRGTEGYFKITYKNRFETKETYGILLIFRPLS